jgi:hypothetical protein
MLDFKNIVKMEQKILIKIIDDERYIKVQNVAYDQIIEQLADSLCDMLDGYVKPFPFRDGTILNSKIDKIIEKINEKRILAD